MNQVGVVPLNTLARGECFSHGDTVLMVVGIPDGHAIQAVGLESGLITSWDPVHLVQRVNGIYNYEIIA